MKQLQKIILLETVNNSIIIMDIWTTKEFGGKNKDRSYSKKVDRRRRLKMTNQYKNNWYL